MSPDHNAARTVVPALLAMIALLEGCGSSDPRPDTDTTTAATLASASSPVPASSGPPPAAVADLMNKSWCRMRGGCRASGNWTLQDGSMNYSLGVAQDEHIMIDASVRNSVLAHAGVMLVGGSSRPDRADAVRTLVDFARDVVGSCPAAVAAITRQYTVPVQAVADVPPTSCGAWDVRAGLVGPDYVLGMERRSAKP